MNGEHYQETLWVLIKAYFQQPLFDQNQLPTFNPLTFRRHYRIQYLEHCWQLDYEIERRRLQLEDHW
ncbi:hypothetical protein C7271_11700 [filamentous cyanobacterium CCP5]|nr:hypothetical protein C7271_11700 [filamentous cyanobacterium CCP5]